MTRNEPIQALRGIAALAVLVHHANGMTEQWTLPNIGLAGVCVFFVISGFIIFRVAEPFDAADYAYRRAVRIFVPYLPVGVFACLAYLWIGHDFDWLASLTLLPGETALQVAWTLQHEVFFYALAGALFALRAPVLGMLVWATLIGLRQLLPVPFDDVQVATLDAVVLHPINLFLIAGTLVARFGTVPNFPVGKALNLLGDASYSLYLVHLPLMGLAWRVGLGFAEMVALSIAAGLAYHWLFEAPALRWLRKHRSASLNANGHRATA